MRTERKGKPSRLDTELKSVLREIGKEKRGIHPEIWARWHEIVGAELASRAVPFHLASKILTIKVSSSAWLQELSYLKHKLKERIELAVGPDIVREIKFRVDTSLKRLAPN